QPDLHRRRLGPEPLVHQPDRAGYLVTHGVDQLHHHGRQHARPGHDVVPLAAHHLGALHHRRAPPPLPARPHLGARHAALRPHGLAPPLGGAAFSSARGGGPSPPSATPSSVSPPPPSSTPSPPPPWASPPTCSRSSRGSRSSATTRWPSPSWASRSSPGSCGDT